MGSEELYRWLDENDEVAFLPVEVVNSPEVIGRNRDMVTINGALGGRHPGPGRRRHDRRRPVLRHRRPRGLRRGPGPVALPARAALPALDLRDRRGRAALADRPLVRRRRGHHHAAPPGRRRRHRVRRRRARGPDGPPARRGAGRDRAPGLPRGAARGGGAGVAGAFAPGAGVAPVKGSKTASSRGTQGGWVEFRRSCLRNSSHPLGGGRRDARTRPSMPPFSDVSGPGQPICRRWPARCPRSGSRSYRAPAPS